MFLYGNIIIRMKDDGRLHIHFTVSDEERKKIKSFFRDNKLRRDSMIKELILKFMDGYKDAKPQ